MRNAFVLTRPREPAQLPFVHTRLAPASRAQTRLLALQVRALGTGNFGVCYLMLDRDDGEQVAVKFLARGSKVLYLLSLYTGVPHMQVT